jgi:hypothetical protein
MKTLMIHALQGAVIGYVITYFGIGVFKTHRSHRIENDDEKETDRKAMLRACWQMAVFGAIFAILFLILDAPKGPDYLPGPFPQ